MKGSEKQIKWAEDIMKRAYQALDDMIAEYDRLDSYGDKTLAFDTLRFYKSDVDAFRPKLDRLFGEVKHAGDLINIRNNFTYDELVKWVKANRIKEV